MVYLHECMSTCLEKYYCRYIISNNYLSKNIPLHRINTSFLYIFISQNDQTLFLKC